MSASRSRACVRFCSRADGGMTSRSSRCDAVAARKSAAVSQYLATPKQSTDSMFDYLYAQLPDGLRAQREEARRYAALRSLIS